MKWLLRILGVVVLLLIIGVAVGVAKIDTVVTEAVETLGPEYTQSEVSLGGVNLSLLSGNLSLADLKVGNPAGYTSPHVFSLGKIAVDVDLQSLASDTLVINSIDIVAPEVIFEQTRNGNNLQALQSNIEKAIGAGSSAESDSTGGKKLVIRDFKVSDGVISYSNALLSDKTLDLPLPEIHLTGIGEKSNGATASEVTEQVLSELTRGAREAVANADVLKDLGDKAKQRLEEEKDKLDGKKEKLKGLLDGFK